MEWKRQNTNGKYLFLSFDSKITVSKYIFKYKEILTSGGSF
jgi:hypothetical protein